MHAVLHLAVLLAGACERLKLLVQFLVTGRLRHVLARILHLQ